MSAASKVRREQPDREIIVFEQTPYTSYSACGIPYFISETIENVEELIVRSPEQFRNKYHIDVRTLHRVTEIDIEHQKVKVLDIGNQTEFWEEYSQLMIATGGKAFCPDVEGHAADGIFGVSTLRSGIKVENFIEMEKPKTAVIVGGGYIGLEMAEALLIRGLKVTIINRGSHVMNTLDPDMGEKISDAIKKLGITLYCNEALTGFKTENNRVTAVVSQKRTIKTDMVILGMGSAPNTSFLKDTGIELGIKNAVKVNARMETNIKNIYAAGDCAETLDLVSKQHTYIALGTVANKTGLVAGSNLAGENISFPGVVGTAVCKLCSYEVARTGLREKDLEKLGIEYVAGCIDSKTRAHYYPGAKDITVKLIAEKNSGRLLGGQIIGEEGAAKRIDVLATALTHNLTLQNIIDLDLSYAPPFSPVWDPVQTAARYLINKI